MKTLADYASALGAELPAGAAAIAVADVSNNSKPKSCPWLFCAVPGAKRDGHDFAKDAVSNGAVALVASRDVEGLPEGFPVLRVEDPHMAWSLVCETHFGNPGKSLSLAAITGTNGKTTSVYILKHLIEGCEGLRCGLVSTVVYDSCGEEPVEASHTTPDAYALQSLLAKMLANGCTHAAMELSSHGLHQRRAGSLKFKAAIFSNLTGDHLDYHLDMESYYQAKKLLFTGCLALDGTAIINVDDPYGSRLRKELSKLLPPERIVACSKALSKAECLIKSMKLSDSHSDIELSILGRSFKFRSHLIGEHNAYNVAGAAAAAVCLGADPKIVEARLSERICVPGRLERFILPSGALAFVDYAHTDDALFRVLSALRPLCKGKLICVFGCGGDRDATKRPRMGAVAAKFSELAVVTSDNPRSEDPLEIIAQIRKGIPRGCRSLELPDRREAIEKAVSEAVRGDIVLVAGKGHESYQEAKGVRIHSDDREILLSLGASPFAL